MRGARLVAYGADPGEARIAAKVDVVRGLVLGYAADPGREDPAITSVEDLYDGATGLPR